MTSEDRQVDVRLIKAQDMPQILPLIQQLNPTIPFQMLKERLVHMVTRGYQSVGAYQGAKLVGVAGMWFGTRFYCGNYIDVDNVVVEESGRSRGVGQLLMNWIEAYAKERGCQVSVLDAYTTNTLAHRFYLRDGYRIIGFHFLKNLTDV